MNARTLLLAVALLFGITETSDIPHTGSPAAVVAVLYFACAAWLRRRRSLVATGILALLFVLEVTQAHTWKVGLAREASVMALGVVGLAAVAGELVARLRARPQNQKGSSPAIS